MHGLKPSKKSKEKIKKSLSPKKDEINNDSNSTIIIPELDMSKQSQEDNLLKKIYSNRLHPPPIGIFSKDLDFNTKLNINTLIPVTINNKKIILGEGSFSIVQLYEDKKTKIKYALKKMDSKKVEKITKNKKLIDTEVNIHGRISHPNIIKLHNYFEYKHFCFLILEYASDGTLFDIIRSKRGLSELYAFYYFLQTLNAIYFLHLHSIIHRDLKPENLLINDNNIIKLCDFGWSVKLNDDKRTTFCGTVEYMAPEIIKKEKYDEAIDVWSLGVLLYELVHSYSPFYSEDLDIKKIGNNITNNNLKFKDGLSKEYKDLVQRLLIKESEKRIKIEDIFQHPFMTKYINMIYVQVNDKSKNNSKNNINKTDIKNKKKILKKNIDKINQVDKKEEDTRETNTNLIFESIPNEPLPKILPESNIFDTEIKKIKTNFFNLKKKPELNLNASQNKLNIDLNKNLKKENELNKNQNKISHVKSFSLGQNDSTFKKLNENRLKIIISINNTQNKNYINKNKNNNRNNPKELCVHHKKSLSNNYFNDDYFGYNSNNGFYNKIYPFQQSENDKKNNMMNTSSKNKTSINHNALNLNNNSNKNLKCSKIFYHDFDNNYIKTDNNHRCQYISMVNTNNTNNYSNIIINNNVNSPTSKKVKQFRNKKLKISNSNYKDLKYLCRVNSDSHKLFLNNSNTKNNVNNNLISATVKKPKKINNNSIKNRNLFQSSIDDIEKNVKISFIDKIINTNNKDLNTFTHKTGIKNEYNTIYEKNNSKNNIIEGMKNHLNFDNNRQNSNKSEK